MVGAFALAFHSEPRFTGDLDLLIRKTPDNAWRNRIGGDLDGVPVFYIDLESFRKNKLAAGRDKDLEDLRRLSKN